MTLAKRRYSPAYYRYREKHPAISIRLTRDLKQALDAYRGELSYSKAMRKLMAEKADVVRAWAELKKFRAEVERLKKGYEEAMRMEHFTLPCKTCGKPMLFSSRDLKSWNEKVMPILRATFANWSQGECLKKRRRLGLSVFWILRAVM